MNKIFLIIILNLSFNLSFCQTQSEMKLEASENYKKADRELNSTYKKIIAEYKDDISFLKNLKISQNLWIKLRDAEINTKFPETEPTYYGSFHPVCVSNFLTELTKKRTKELKIWLVGIEEGDMCSGSVKTKS